GVLRLQDGGGAERAPQPGVADLDSLIAGTADTGLSVDLEVTGPPRELPSAIDLSAYRIVQEALTNVVRHAAAQHVQIVLSYLPDRVEVTVSDDGRGPQAAPNGSSGGHGLVGMRERVALFAGTLETGPGAAGRGYRLTASLPTG